MKKEDTIIYYRPNLANTLKKDLKFMINYYNQNFQQMYYALLHLLCKSKNDKKGEKLFNDVNKWFNQPCDILELFEEHKNELMEYGESDIISSARAFYTLNKIYREEFNNLISKIDFTDLTKQEQYMVKHFYSILLSPTRNPNIEIKKGRKKCYYDDNYHYGEFERDLQSGIEYLNKECNSIIGIFEISD